MVANNFLGNEMPLSVFLRDTFRGSKESAYFLGFLCAHQNDTLDNLFLLVLATTLNFAVLPRALAISHLNKTFTMIISFYKCHYPNHSSYILM